MIIFLLAAVWLPAVVLAGTAPNNPTAPNSICDIGSLDTDCIINTDKEFDEGVTYQGTGNLFIANASLEVKTSCYGFVKPDFTKCLLQFIWEGSVKINNASIIGPHVSFSAGSFNMAQNTVIRASGKGKCPSDYGSSDGQKGKGAGHGGVGGQSCITSTVGGVAGGSLTKPTRYGACANIEQLTSYTPGGGVIEVLAVNDIILDGGMYADGMDATAANGGGGAGGSVLITSTSGQVKGDTGILSANGGSGNAGGGGGGGGRIAVNTPGRVSGLTVTTNGGPSPVHDSCENPQVGGSGTYAANEGGQLSVICKGLQQKQWYTIANTPLGLSAGMGLYSLVLTSCNMLATTALCNISGSIDLTGTSQIYNDSSLTLCAPSIKVGKASQITGGAKTTINGDSLYVDTDSVVEVSGKTNLSIKAIDIANTLKCAEKKSCELRIYATSLVLRDKATISSDFIYVFASDAVRVTSGVISSSYQDFGSNCSEARKQIPEMCTSFPPTPTTGNAAVSVWIRAPEVHMHASKVVGAIVVICATNATFGNSQLDAAGLGCRAMQGIGAGATKQSFPGGGGGHGGVGGKGQTADGSSAGGVAYDEELSPARPGSGGGSASYGSSGGGIVIVSAKSVLTIPAASFNVRGKAGGDDSAMRAGGGGGGGGSIFVSTANLVLDAATTFELGGGKGGSPGGGGGGGGIMHISWTEASINATRITVQPVVNINGGGGGSSILDANIANGGGGGGGEKINMVITTPPPTPTTTTSSSSSSSSSSSPYGVLSPLSPGKISTKNSNNNNNNNMNNNDNNNNNEITASPTSINPNITVSGEAGNVGFVSSDPPCGPGSSGLFCELCPAGTSKNISGNRPCAKCIAGLFSANPGAIMCAPCSAGKFSHSGEANCTTCPGGEVSNESAQKCTKCTPGRSSQPGMSTCAVCAANTISPEGASSCDPCPIGTESPEGASKCTACPPNPPHSIFVGRGCAHECETGFVQPDCNTPFQRLVSSLGGYPGFAAIVICTFVFTAGPILYCWFRQRQARKAREIAEWEEIKGMNARPRSGAGGHRGGQKKRRRSSSSNIKKVPEPSPSQTSLPAISDLAMSEEDLPFHLHRIYLQGSNSANSPWSLHPAPDPPISGLVDPGEYAHFATELKEIVAWKPWEKKVHTTLLCVFFPAALIFERMRRKIHLQRLWRYHLEYNHAFIRNSHARALTDSLKLNVSPCLSMCWIDVLCYQNEDTFGYPLGKPRLPVVLVCAGTGEFSSPFFLDPTDELVKSLAGYFGCNWFKFIAYLNTHLRTIPWWRLSDPRALKSALKYVDMMNRTGIGIGRNLPLGGIKVQLGVTLPSREVPPVLKKDSSGSDPLVGEEDPAARPKNGSTAGLGGREPSMSVEWRSPLMSNTRRRNDSGASREASMSRTMWWHPGGPDQEEGASGREPGGEVFEKPSAGGNETYAEAGFTGYVRPCLIVFAEPPRQDQKFTQESSVLKFAAQTGPDPPSRSEVRSDGEDEDEERNLAKEKSEFLPYGATPLHRVMRGKVILPPPAPLFTHTFYLILGLFLRNTRKCQRFVVASMGFIVLLFAHITLNCVMAICFGVVAPELYVLTLALLPLCPVMLSLLGLVAASTANVWLFRVFQAVNLCCLLNSTVAVLAGFTAVLGRSHLLGWQEGLLVPIISFVVTVLLIPASQLYVSHLEYSSDIRLSRKDYIKNKLNDRGEKLQTKKKVYGGGRGGSEIREESGAEALSDASGRLASLPPRGRPRSKRDKESTNGDSPTSSSSAAVEYTEYDRLITGTVRDNSFG